MIINDGSIIRKIREEKGISQAELGAMVGLTADRIQKYENRARNPKTPMLDQIYKALGVYVKYDTRVEIYHNFKPVESCDVNCDVKSIFKEKLKNLREKNNFTHKDLAELVGITESEVMALEKGDEEPTLSVIAKFVQIFGISADYFCKTDTEKKQIAETICHCIRIENRYRRL